MAKVKGIK